MKAFTSFHSFFTFLYFYKEIYWFRARYTTKKQKHYLQRIWLILLWPKSLLFLWFSTKKALFYLKTFLQQVSSANDLVIQYSFFIVLKTNILNSVMEPWKRWEKDTRHFLSFYLYLKNCKNDKFLPLSIHFSFCHISLSQINDCDRIISWNFKVH